MILASVIMLYEHAFGSFSNGYFTSLTAQGESLLLDVMLGIPVVGLATWLADLVIPEPTDGPDGRTGGGPGSRAAYAAATALWCLPLFVPLFSVQHLLHQVVSGGNAVTTGNAIHQHAATVGLGGLRTSLSAAVAVQPVVFTAALLALAVLGRSATAALSSRRWARRVARLGVVCATATVTAVTGPLQVTGQVLTLGTSANAALDAEAAATNCDNAPTRNFDVSAINLDLTVDRYGDHDPFGFMYVLNAEESKVRAQEAALKAAATDPNGATTGAKVSTGLKDDPIQPLVLRAPLGTCVVVNLTNKLTQPPRGGPGFSTTPVVTQPGGVPSVSFDLQGVAYDASTGGGQSVGATPTNVMVAPGGTHTYRFFLDSAIGEGGKVFHSGGDATQITAHGLFGTLVAEPAGSKWFDPRTGQDRSSDVTWNSWDAIVQPTNEPTFREFVLAYHEIGDENFNLRRPQREGDPSGLTPDPGDGNGAPLPMADDLTQAQAGGQTDSYRPGSRALNYRSEPFYRRLSQLNASGHTVQDLLDDESLAYGSYMFGDPATPMPRSYLGEPTKTRLVHPGFEQLHVHHLHGGGDRWRQNPDADDTDIDGGLSKTPVQNAKSIRLDSQTVGPNESFNLEHECGAGGCQQAAGDFLYHCHIAHHYIAGMWGFWRVFNTKQDDLATLPGRAAAPTAVNSAGLLGRQIEGKTVVLKANLTNASTQVALEDLVEGQLPPQGVRLDEKDASVWNWSKSGAANAPVYFGEPEDTTVWPDFASPTPGERPQIMFDPLNGRPAWPMLRPHLAQRPPFSPNGHSGTPYLGNTATSSRPDGLCPQSAPMRNYNVTAVSVPIQETIREKDNNGEIYVLNEDKDALVTGAKNGTKNPTPLAIRSNVGDCVAITLSNELDPAVQSKVNMHTHFVQFDPQASDGVITGFSYEQSVYSDTRENRTSTAAVAAGSTTITVSNTDRLRTGISIGVGVGRADIEQRTITAIDGSTLTFDRALTNAHASGEPVTVEFVQYRWFSDVDSGTVFWHDHVNGIKSWAHGLFGAHIIEPAGSTYHDPTTGAEIRSGAIADIHTTGSVGTGQRGSFREFMIWLGNGRRGRPELTNAAFNGILGMNRDFGQECEEGAINLRAAPVGERTPGGATPADPATTDQRQEFDGAVCRSTTSNINDGNGANTVNAQVTTVDPYVFSSVKYGDPMTPLLRAYVGDPVVVRTIGLNERVEGLRIQGHRFRQERFNADGELTDTASTGISERFDYVLDGGAGGTSGLPGDYMYYSSRNFAFETGAWGIFRVHDKRQSSLQPLPDRAAPPTGSGFPLLSPATGNTQQNPGPNPPAASSSNVSSTKNPCPTAAPTRAYAVSIFNMALPTRPTSDPDGVVYALTSDVAAIKAGTKKMEPLVLRANVGDCVQVTLTNAITAGSKFGGTRAGFDVGKILSNPQNSGGTAVGLNPDTTVATGQATTYRYFADKGVGTAVFRNGGNEASIRHGAYGLLVVEPQNSTWFDSTTNAPLTATTTSSQAIIRVAGGQSFREFALTMETTDQHYGRSIVGYQDVVAGAGVNSTFSAGNAAEADKGESNISYQNEPLTVRLGLTSTPPNPNANFAQAFSSSTFGDPKTPLFRAYAGDPVVFRLGIGASDQFHEFTIGGHEFPKEPNMWNGTTDLRSSLLAARAVTAGETVDAKLVGGAGGPRAVPGDYLYGDARQPFAEAGMWGIFRVVPTATTLGDLARL